MESSGALGLENGVSFGVPFFREFYRPTFGLVASNAVIFDELFVLDLVGIAVDIDRVGMAGDRTDDSAFGAVVQDSIIKAIRLKGHGVTSGVWAQKLKIL